jgi:hypothetical protein
MTEAPTPSMVYDIIEASAQTGCPLCRVADRWGERFMAAILYEEVTDPHTRGRLKQSFGFCRDHAWQAADVGGTLLGMSIIYRGLLAQISSALGEAAAPEKKGWWRTIGGRSRGDAAALPGLSAQTECPACAYLRDMEDVALVAITDALPGNERLRQGLSRMEGGLCLPHLRGALQNASSQEAFAFLQTTTRTKLDALIGEMDEFIRKYDHRFRREEWGSERDSWQRAIAWIAGGLIAPEREL